MHEKIDWNNFACKRLVNCDIFMYVNEFAYNQCILRVFVFVHKHVFSNFASLKS